MRKLILLLLITITSTISLYAQNIIDGKILNKDSNPIEMAIISILNPSTNGVIAFGYSDKSGDYKISYKSQLDSVIIMVSGLMIGSHTKQTKNISQRVDFNIVEQAMNIKEVVVKSQPIRQKGDTINYSVRAFIDDNDNAIEDVIKKLPGITLETSGVIKYQGRPINKFYVEGMDMLQGRYGIATKNISANDIATVQIMENHQPIKALEDISPSDKAAINLKLKNGIKGVFMLTAQLGAGAEINCNKVKPLWDNSITGMIFSRKMQNMALYSGNNIGKDTYKEFKSHTTSDQFGSNNMVWIAMPTPPSIKLERYLFNNANSISINNLNRTKNEDDIVVNALYLNDHINSDSHSRTTIFMPDGSQTIINEQSSATQKLNRLEANIKFESNQKQRYLNNNVNISTDLIQNIGNIYNNKSIIQNLNNDIFKITDSFNAIKNKNGKGYNLSINGGYMQTPQNLTVYDTLYPDIFNDGDNYSAIRQNVTIKSGYANATYSRISLFHVGRILVDPNIRAGFDYSGLNSNIEIWQDNKTVNNVDKENMRNDLSWFKYFVKAGIGLRYEYRSFKIGAELPINYNFIEVNNRPQNSKDKHNLVWFEPSAYIDLNLTSRLKLNARYELNNSTANIKTMYTGYILQDYRTINSYDELLPKARINRATTGVEYKNILRMIFTTLDFSYFKNLNNATIKQYYEGILAINSRLPLENISESIRVDGRISKGFDFCQIIVGAEGSYSRFSSEQLRQESLVSYNNDVVEAKLTFTIKPVKFLRLSYEGKWNRSFSRITDGESFIPINSMVNEAKAEINFTKNLFTTLIYETYYNSAALGDKNISFGDISLTYKLKKADMSLVWNNIFNAKQFMISRYSTLDEYQYSYNIRPSNVMFKILFKIL